MVPGVDPPEILMGPNSPLVIALKISPKRLVDIRRQRLISIKEDPNTAYASEEAVREEITWANRLFARMKWKTIDVSRRSVEETAAAILNTISESGRN